MILSVSRRTDIPAFYTEWFMNRIRDGSVCVKNPFNAHQISRINIKPDVVDCIVFWTKDPRPLMDKLDELDERGYKYYFQMTITPYGKDLETDVPEKKELVKAFKNLSERIGSMKTILRYDPIIFTDKYTMDFHERAFKKLCQQLEGYTQRIVISYLDSYRKVSRNMKGINLIEPDEKMMIEIAKKFFSIAKLHGMNVQTCAEAIDLEHIGISHGKCIDGDLIEKIIGYEIKNKDKRDANREHCGCMKCIDIGQYDSCIHNCLYCYANVRKEKARSNHEMHNPESPILIGNHDESLATDRKGIKSFKIKKDKQVKLF